MLNRSKMCNEYIIKCPLELFKENVTFDKTASLGEKNIFMRTEKLLALQSPVWIITTKQ